jgi:hypothetical protein
MARLLDPVSISSDSHSVPRSARSFLRHRHRLVARRPSLAELPARVAAVRACAGCARIADNICRALTIFLSRLESLARKDLPERTVSKGGLQIAEVTGSYCSVGRGSRTDGFVAVGVCDPGGQSGR